MAGKASRENGLAGGRPKGSRNKRTLAQKEKIIESGITPLDFLMSIVRDNNEDQIRRIDAAKAAAPYVHPRLANINHGGQEDNPVITEIVLRSVKADS